VVQIKNLDLPESQTLDQVVAVANIFLDCFSVHPEALAQ
jgi:hypothetical protein